MSGAAAALSLLLLALPMTGTAAPGVATSDSPDSHKGAAATVSFTDYASEFDRFEERTRDMPMAQRTAAFRALFEHIRPGLYTARDPKVLDLRIAQALSEFPTLRERYRAVERRFPGALASAVQRFREHFDGFEPPMPIILAHELGARDGGSDYVAGQKVMLFGADVIAKLHDDDSLQPFLTHELFHLEHARHFADCDQLWCPLWQEGLATFVAAQLTPGASDHQLLLDAPLRQQTESHWPQALCLLASEFDSTDEDATGDAFLVSRHPPQLPPRFGYYAGMRIATELAHDHSLVQLAQLDDEQARPLVAAALGRLLKAARADCAAPPLKAPVTHASPRPA